MSRGIFESLQDGIGYRGHRRPVFQYHGHSIVYYHCGLQLDPFEKDMRRFTEVLEDYGQTYFLAIYKTHVQFILNLMGQSDDPTIRIKRNACECGARIQNREHCNFSVSIE
jgi:hypothetical protein